MADHNETERLINLVKEFKFLYDFRHPDYKDTLRKVETWRDIAYDLGQPWEVVRQKWKNLRDSYVKYLKCVNGAASQSASKFKHWQWAEHLEFLREILSLRIGVYVAHAPSQNQSGENEPFSSSGENSNGGDESQQSDSLLKPQKLPKDSNPPNLGVDEMIVMYLENKIQSSSLTRTDHLFLSYAETFKGFSPVTQAKIKMEMAQMFGNAELSDMDNPVSKRRRT